MSDHECFNCGSTEGVEAVGDTHVCVDCISAGDTHEEDDVECGHDDHTHDHDRCRANISDSTAAARLAEAVEVLIDAGADPDRLRLLPKQGADEKGLAHFELGEGALDKDEVRFYEYTPEEAIEAVRGGHPGFAVYYGMERYGTEDVLAIDVDERETFPYDELPETAKFCSGSGRGDHLIFNNDGTVDNANADDPVDGEVRANRLYTVLPGSTHDSGGMYDITERREPATLSNDDLPESLTPNAGFDGEIEEKVKLDPPGDDDPGQFTTEHGLSLAEIREKDETLDDLCRYLNPPGHGHNDTSRFDHQFCRRLLWWGFSRGEIRRIWRHHRHRKKVANRSDYVPRTIRDAETYVDGGYDPDYGKDQFAPASLLPLERLDSIGHSGRRRYATKRGIEWPTTDDVRDRLEDRIKTAVAEKKDVVISAPTGSGKTHTVATEPWLSAPENEDNQPTIHAHGTHDARDEGVEKSVEAGVDYFTLKGREELCSCAAGAHDPEYDEDGNIENDDAVVIDGVGISEWIKHKCDKQGLPFSVVHTWAEQEVDGDLPCEIDGTECPAKGQFDKVPRNGDGECEYDVIHCTHQFLMVPSMRMHTNVFLDEKPSFSDSLDGDLVRRSVNGYLDYIDAPVDSYHELIHAVKNGKPLGWDDRNSYGGLTKAAAAASFREEMDAALSFEPSTVECTRCDGEGELETHGEESHELSEYDESIGTERDTTCPKCHGNGEVFKRSGKPPLTWYRENPNVHALAPAFTRAIWTAEQRADGRKHARIPYKPPRLEGSKNDKAGWNRIYVDVVMDEQWEIEDAAVMPDFSLANCVVGLDAHPQQMDPKWCASVKPEIPTEFVLTTDERTLYRRYERGLFTVQVGEGVQPVTSGKWWDQGQGDKFKAIINHLREHHGEKFRTAITSKALRPKVRQAMLDAGVEDPELMHFGAEESRNDFAGEEVGLVIGSIDPGDRQVVNTLARLGYDAKPRYHACPNCDGAGYVENHDGEESVCETCHGEGEVREHGRTFEGPDAEKAQHVLEGVREHHVAQAAGRWARHADDPNDHATVYVVTEAAPEGFIDAKTPGVTWSTTPEQRERLEYVRDQPDGATAKEVAEACDCSKQSAWRTLNKAEEEGLLEYSPGAGPHGAYLYWTGEKFTPDGAVDLTPESAPPDAGGKSQRSAYEDNNTFTVTVDTLPNCAYNIREEERDGWLHQSTFEWYERALAPPG